MYAIIKNNIVDEYPIADIRQSFPDISFPRLMTVDSLPQNVVQIHPTTQPTINRMLNGIREVTPALTNGVWTQQWEVYELEPEVVRANQQAASEALQQSIVDATQQRLDSFARTRNYDGILSACTYATSNVPKFAAEGQVAVNLRDATWAALYQILEEVQAGQREAPTGFSDIEPLLPPLEWPV